MKNKVLGISIPKNIELLIKNRMYIINEPYMFKIIGVSGHGYSLSESAHKLYEKVKIWAEKEGAEVNLIQDHYSDIYKDLPIKNRIRSILQGKGQTKGFLKIEITDPAARILEHIINNW